MSTKRHRIIAAASIVVVLAGIGGTAAANAASRPESARVNVNTQQVAAVVADPGAVSTAEQLDLLALLLAGTGPLAEANPDLVQFLGFNPDRPAVDQAALRSLSKQYLKHDREFTSTAEAIASGDPMAVEAALVTFTASFHDFLTSQGKVAKDSSDRIAATGCGWKGCFAITLYVTANVAVYANVAGATNAVATLVLAWFYLMDSDGQETQLERDHLVSLMASSLSTSD